MDDIWIGKIFSWPFRCFVCNTYGLEAQYFIFGGCYTRLVVRCYCEAEFVLQRATQPEDYLDRLCDFSLSAEQRRRLAELSIYIDEVS